MSKHVVKFSLIDPNSYDLWLRLGKGRFTTYDQLCDWLRATYQAEVVDISQGYWYIQFPDESTHTQFVLTWQ
jgi:hypothetical protein